MEGWNDCPLPMLSNNTPRTRKRPTRIVNSTAGSVPQMTPSNSGGPPLSTPPLPPSIAQLPVTNASSPETNLRELASQYKLVQEDDKDLLKQLMEAITLLEQLEKDFLNLILVAALSRKPLPVLKGQLLKYMMTNSESSQWCTSLQKLVEMTYDPIK